MLILILLSKLIGSEVEIGGRATVYTAETSGKHLASCIGKDPITRRYPCRRCFFVGQKHIAHRWLPLGTVGTLCNRRTGLCTQSVVRDRGPWGAIRPCSKGKPAAGRRLRRIRWKNKCYWWQVQIHLSPGFKRRGKFDLTRALAKEIKLRSFDFVTFKYRVEKKKGKQRLVSYSGY